MPEDKRNQENLGRTGRLHDLQDTSGLPASSPANKLRISSEKNIEKLFLPHGKNTTSPLQKPVN
jgi:hypothetical protein